MLHNSLIEGTIPELVKKVTVMGTKLNEGQMAGLLKGLEAVGQAERVGYKKLTEGRGKPHACWKVNSVTVLPFMTKAGKSV